MSLKMQMSGIGWEHKWADTDTDTDTDTDSVKHPDN